MENIGDCFDKPILVIDKSCMYRVKVENIEDLDKSYFKDAYATAFKILNEIIRENDKFNDNKCPLNCKYLEERRNSDNCNNCVNYKIKDKNSDLDFEEVINNIISFVGERGSGKTSAMKSFIKMIKSIASRKAYDEIAEHNIEKPNKSFYITDLIDPSTFSRNDSIIEIIIAELFKVFKYNEECEMSEKQELLKCFEKVFKDLRVLNKEKSKIFEDNFDNIDILLDLSSAISLKSNLYELIKKILKIESNDYLIIQIDDLDMNVSAGAKMLEDLRKYLNLPNVIVVMAAKYDQLFEVVKQENIKYMDTLYKYTKDMGGEKEAFAEEINIKTEKYLEKLIPTSRRIYLPEVSINNTSVILNFDNYKDNRNGMNLEPEDVSIKIKRLFYEKLRIVIITDKAAESIIPKNLRSFIQFIKLLYDLENVYDKDNKESNMDKSELKVWNNTALKNNVDKFKNMISEGYIFNTGSFSKYESSKFLYCKIEQLNKLIVEYLNMRILKNIKDYDYDKESKWYNYVDYIERNRIYLKDQNISYGDVITWIAIYEGLNLQENERKTIEFVKLIYSVRFVEALYKEDFNIHKINGPDFIGNYFEIMNSTTPRGTRVFKEEAEFIGNRSFNINIGKERYGNVIDIANDQQKLEIVEKERNIYGKESGKSQELYNITLYNLSRFFINFKATNKENDIIKEEFIQLFRNILYFYNCLEYKYSNSLDRFIRDDSYYNLYNINNNSGVGFQKHYYFRAFNLISCYLFEEDISYNFYEKVFYGDSENFLGCKNKSISTKNFLLNIDFFMDVLTEIMGDLNKERPEDSYESRVDYWLRTGLRYSIKTINNRKAEYQRLIQEDNNSTQKYHNSNGDIRMDFYDVDVLPFIMENIYIDNKKGFYILGNTNDINNASTNIKNCIIKMINYLEKKRNNNTTAGNSIDNQLRKYLNELLEVGEDEIIVKKYYELLNGSRKKFIDTAADINEKNKLIDDFVSKLNELKEQLS